MHTRVTPERDEPCSAAAAVLTRGGVEGREEGGVASREGKGEEEEGEGEEEGVKMIESREKLAAMA